MSSSFIKISRYGHRFWVRDCREIEPDVWVGIVDNDLGENVTLKIGEKAAFTTPEIIERFERKLEVVK